MDIVSAVIFGIIQGATEFIPVSSSAHLALLHDFFGLIEQDAYPGFDVALHAGTLIAVLTAYRKDVPGLFAGLFTAPLKLLKNRSSPGILSRDEKTACFAVIATLPAVAAALAGAGKLSDVIALYPAAIGALLILNGLILLIPDGYAGRGTGADGIKPYHALGVGLFQAAAVVPGLSRSGMTVTGGVLCGIELSEAVRLSFITSIPAVLGACVLKLPEAFASAPSPAGYAVYAAGFCASTAAGLLAIGLIRFISEKSRFRYFSIYCFAVGSYALYRGLHG